MSETKAAELRTYTYEELAGHDVYELAHSGWTGEVYWSEDSLYLTDDDDGLPMLLPLFYEGPIPDFRWDAPTASPSMTGRRSGRRHWTRTPPVLSGCSGRSMPGSPKRTARPGVSGFWASEPAA